MQIEELGQVLFNLVCVTPKGMVVFFPSYNFLNVAKAAWGQSGTLARLEGRKKIFFEPEETTDVDKVLQSYAAAVHEAVRITSSPLFPFDDTRPLADTSIPRTPLDPNLVPCSSPSSAPNSPRVSTLPTTSLVPSSSLACRTRTWAARS